MTEQQSVNTAAREHGGMTEAEAAIAVTVIEVAQEIPARDGEQWLEGRAFFDYCEDAGDVYISPRWTALGCSVRMGRIEYNEFMNTVIRFNLRVIFRRSGGLVFITDTRWKHDDMKGVMEG